MLAFTTLNPIRFKNFDRQGFIKEVCGYTQKWETGDTLDIQILSSEERLIPFKALDARSSKVVFTGESSLIETGIDTPYRFVHSLVLDIADLPPLGEYRLFVAGDYLSYPFSVNETQPDTILLRYKNTENKLSAVFSSGWSPSFRVEGGVFNYASLNENTLYRGQSNAPIMLASTPLRAFTLAIGTGRGVPVWVVDAVNTFLSCDTKTLNGVPFEIEEGAGLEIEIIERLDRVAATVSVMDGKGSASPSSLPLVWSQNGINAISQNGSNVIQLQKL